VKCIRKRTKEKYLYFTAAGICTLLISILLAWLVIKPGLALQKEVCEITEHMHDETCYTDGDDLEFIEQNLIEGISQSGQSWILHCTLEEHEHTIYCQDTNIENPQQSDPGTPAVQEEDSCESFESYIQSLSLHYRTEDTGWKEYDSSVTLPANADLKLYVTYADIPLSLLERNAGTLYASIPEMMENAAVSSVILVEGNTCGTMEAAGDKVYLHFDQNWLAGLLEREDSATITISGDFQIESQISLDYASGSEEGELVMGEVSISIRFDSDVLVKYGNVILKKEIDLENDRLIETEDGLYIRYLLTVQAGSAGSADVFVEDSFIQNAEYVIGFVQIEEAERILESERNGFGAFETLDDNSKEHGSICVKEETLIWTIGDMEPFETRTLSYDVKLDETYAGSVSKGSLVNVATVKPGTPVQQTASAMFTPKAAVTPKKWCSAKSELDDGSMLLTYSIKVTAAASNSYSVHGLQIKDGFYFDINKTSASYLPYIDFLEESFVLMQSDGTKESVTPVFDTSIHGFTVDVGSIAPGKDATLTYSVVIEPGIYVAAGQNAPRISNRMWLLSSARKARSTHIWNKYLHNVDLKKQSWIDKTEPERIEEDLIIEMDENVYVQQGNTFIKENVSSFTVPAGSYCYALAAGDTDMWDLSNAVISDSYSKEGLINTGYLQVVKVYQGEIEQSAWLKIDGSTSFSFSFADLGFSGSGYYELIYFAKPDFDPALQIISMQNSASLQGSVSSSSFYYTLPKATVSVSSAISSASSFGVEKIGWNYREQNVQGSAAYIDWVIQVSSSAEIPEGFTLLDTPEDAVMKNISAGKVIANALAFEEECVLSWGILKEGLDWSETDDSSVLQNSGLWQELDIENLTWKMNGEGNLEIETKSAVSLLEEEKLVVLVRTMVNDHALPSTDRACITYSNSISSSMSGDDFIFWNTASMDGAGGPGILKELGLLFEWDGENMDVLQDGTLQVPATTVQLDGQDITLEPGTYIAWQIQLNYLGELNGTYYFTDTLPQGVELVYAAIWWAGSEYANKEAPPETAEIENLSADWQRHEVLAKNRSPGTLKKEKSATIYYTSGSRVLFKTENIEPAAIDKAGVEFQIVCRIQDPDILLEGQEKELVNTADLYSAQGIFIESNQSEVSVTKSTLSKQTDIQPGSSAVIPFEIRVNPLGEDLISGAEEVTVVDEIYNPLCVDYNSISVINSTTLHEIPFKLSQNQSGALLFTIPDNIPVTIRYEAVAEISPETQFAIVNNAWFYGYSPQKDSTVLIVDYSYSASAGAVVNTRCSLQITKRDAANLLGEYLEGAEFAIYQTNVEEDELSLSGDPIWSGTTVSGKSLLATVLQDGSYLSYNTVYALVETRAPDGYVKEEEPYYFTVAREEDGEWPQFLDTVHVTWSGSVHKADILNSKGSITAEKKFLSLSDEETMVSGTWTFGLYASDPKTDPNANPVQMVSIETPEETSAVFENLDIGRTWYVYELDDEQNPILPGNTAFIHQKSFLVSCDTAQIYLSDENPDQNLEIVNHVRYAVLPQTGGNEHILYRTGAALIGMALLPKIRRRKD
jgi:hypothetical protein